MPGDPSPQWRVRATRDLQVHALRIDRRAALSGDQGRVGDVHRWRSIAAAKWPVIPVAIGPGASPQRQLSLCRISNRHRLARRYLVSCRRPRRGGSDGDGYLNYSERRRDKLHSEWVKLDRQKPFAWLLFVAASALFVSNYLGVNEPINQTLGGLTFMGALAGAYWLWTLRKEANRIFRLSVENNKELDRL